MTTSARYVDTGFERARWRFTSSFRVTPRLQIGLEHNAAASETNFIGNWIAHLETARVPMIAFGTSSDRIGTPEGPLTYYVSFAKTVPSTRMAPYVSLAYSEFERGFNVPFGLNYQIQPGLSALFMNDGRKSHLLLTHSQKTWSVSAMWIWFERPGISLGYNF